MVKVKLSVQVLPDKRPSINVEDVLQATGESRAANNRESPSTSNLSAEREQSSTELRFQLRMFTPLVHSVGLAVGKRSSNVKKRIPRSSKRVINDQNTEWVPSESFATLRESVDIPQGEHSFWYPDVTVLSESGMVALQNSSLNLDFFIWCL